MNPYIYDIKLICGDRNSGLSGARDKGEKGM